MAAGAREPLKAASAGTGGFARVVETHGFQRGPGSTHGLSPCSGGLSLDDDDPGQGDGPVPKLCELAHPLDAEYMPNRSSAQLNLQEGDWSD